ncbi:MAG: putative transcriptional regulator [bacterium]|jgi:predicted transcriptional regulator
MKRLPMRKIREALWLRSDGFSGRRVALSLSLGRATISEYFRRADVEGLSWPIRDIAAALARSGWPKHSDLIVLMQRAPVP